MLLHTKKIIFHNIRLLLKLLHAHYTLLFVLKTYTFLLCGDNQGIIAVWQFMRKLMIKISIYFV
jgi:ABC-type iron transport system FetAB permease component